MKIYYHKIGIGILHSKRITLLKVVKDKLLPTHKYTNVSSWKAAKEILAQLYPNSRVRESADMFIIEVKLLKM